MWMPCCINIGHRTPADVRTSKGKTFHHQTSSSALLYCSAVLHHHLQHTNNNSMRLLIIAAASLAVVSCASLSLEDLEFHAWKLKFAKSYSSPEEEAHRKNLWLSTRRRVLTHNILADQGIKTYHMGMNQFSDMDDQEYRQAVGLGEFVLTNKTKSTAQEGVMMTSRQEGGTKLPDSMDYRICVTHVKKQGPCGSSWAFSATGALESHTCLKYARLPSLSEQQLVDCSGSYGNLGCNGGSVTKAYKYIIGAGGIESDLFYPYEAKTSLCRFNSDYIAALCLGFVILPPGDELALQTTVAYVGPVSVAIDSAHDSFRHYLTGVYYEPQCKNLTSTLGMLVVGYGTDGGKDYWLLKNNWGVTWGNQGYMKMSRNQNNHCGIASYGSYPLV